MEEVHEVTVAGLRIAYRRRGDGPPLVLLHGGVADSRAWRRQMDDLSDAYTVVAWDAPGCGRSDDPPEAFRLPDYADTLAGFIDALALHRPHVLGLSFGGGLAIQLCDRHPAVPRTLVLAGAYAGWAGSLPPEEVRARVERGLEQIRGAPEDVVDAWLPTLFSDDVADDVVEETAEIMADFHPAGARVMLRAFAEADLREALPRIDVPTLLLYGAADVRSPPSVAESIHAAIPGAELVFLEGVGHVASAEAPARFNAEVRRFLEAAGSSYRDTPP